MWVLGVPHDQYVKEIVSGLLSLSILLMTTYFMCIVVIKKSIERKQVEFFFCGLILMSIFQGILLCFMRELLLCLELESIFPISENEQKKLLSIILCSFPITIFLNLGFCGLKFYFEHTKLYAQYLELQKVYLEGRLHALQIQINPHFMFNVLNHIQILMQKDTDMAASLLIRYSEILRYQLYGTKREYVYLDQELEFLDNYINVEKYRWKNTLDVNFKKQIETGRKEIPPLLLVTFIENAFKYVSKGKVQKGYIDIEIEQQGNIIRMEVENSKSLYAKTDNKNSGLGLENVKKRLDILYAGNHNLSIKETDNVYHVRLILKEK
jgi:hypothetical protein